jgi:hypothetical protein
MENELINDYVSGLNAIGVPGAVHADAVDQLQLSLEMAAGPDVLNRPLITEAAALALVDSGRGPASQDAETSKAGIDKGKSKEVKE